MLQRLVDELRSLLPVLVSAGGNEDEGIKRWIACLDYLANEFAQQTNWEVDGGGGNTNLTSCLIASSCLRLLRLGTSMTYSRGLFGLPCHRILLRTSFSEL